MFCRRHVHSSESCHYINVPYIQVNSQMRKDTFPTRRNRSSGGVVVKLLACRARGPGFDSRLALRFQRLVIPCFQVAIWLKDRLSNINPQTNQPRDGQSLMFACADRHVICYHITSLLVLTEERMFHVINTKTV